MFPNTSFLKFLNKIKYLFLFLCLCVIFFLSFYFLNNQFLIKKIKLVSDKKITIVNKYDLFNKNFIFFNEKSAAEKIIRENYYVKSATIEKVWPSTVKISLTTYSPCAILIVNEGVFELSCDGRILEKLHESTLNLPIINFYQKLNSNFFQTGDWIDYKDIKQALYFIDKLGQINIFPLTIDIKGQDMLVFNLIGTKKIIFSNNKDKEIQDYQLELIIKQFKIEGKEYRKIDLRFNKPIIEF